MLAFVTLLLEDPAQLWWDRGGIRDERENRDGTLGEGNFN